MTAVEGSVTDCERKAELKNFDKLNACVANWEKQG
jgi:hypothetical protein